MLYIGLAGEELLGYWHVTWNENDKATYTIKKRNSVVRMSIFTCGWEETACKHNKTVDITHSKSKEYPAEESWVQVVDIHSGYQTIYMRKEGNLMRLQWHNYYEKTQRGGIGRRG